MPLRGNQFSKMKIKHGFRKVITMILAHHHRNFLSYPQKLTNSYSTFQMLMISREITTQK